MKPAPFRYFDPASPEEVLALLHEWGEESKVLAGGQTLGPMLNFRALSPAVLIDINGVEGLAYHTPLRGGHDHRGSDTAAGAGGRRDFCRTTSRLWRRRSPGSPIVQSAIAELSAAASLMPIRQPNGVR